MSKTINSTLSLGEVGEFLREISWASKIVQGKILMSLRDVLTEKFREMELKEIETFLKSFPPIEKDFAGKIAEAIEDELIGIEKLEKCSLEEMGEFLNTISSLNRPLAERIVASIKTHLRKRFETANLRELVDFFRKFPKNNRSVARKIALTTKSTLKSSKKFGTEKLNKIGEFLSEISYVSKALAKEICKSIENLLRKKVKKESLNEIGEFFEKLCINEEAARNALEASEDLLKQARKFKTAELSEIKNFFQQISRIDKTIAKNILINVKNELKKTIKI